MISTAQASRDQFMQLLVAQIQNQDPLEPVGQEEMIAQLAQFSTLEGIENLNGNFEQMLEANQSMLHLNEMTQAGSLIGRAVEYKSDGKPAAGVVDSVSIDSQSVSVVVGGESVSLDRILRLGRTV